MKRRDLLKACAALPALALSATATKLWAAPASEPRVLVIFLRGGYDCANVLVPVSSSFYYESRPNIAIGRPGSGPDTAFPLDADWGLHPALSDSLLPLWNAGQAAFIPFAGTHDASRSHFATQDGIELGQPLDAVRDFQSGFLNRLAGAMGRGPAIAFTDQVPVAFRGAQPVHNIALRTTAKPSIDARQTAAIAAMYRDTPLDAPVSEGFALRDQLQREMTAEMDASSRNAISANGFEVEARRIGRLMRERYALGFVDVGGWDTHVAEGGATGYLAGRLRALGRGITAFAGELGGRWSDTTVIVMSEFGRTFRENGNRGTDHGHGSVYWALGGGIRGGRVAGEQVKVEASTLFQNRDYVVRNEYRSVLGGLFARMYALDPVRVQAVFPGVQPADLRLV